ncbi:GNAT family N-acetyltransferase [Fusibacter ferrireducens]|uniref:GNAT family N-acetyltransferase n=1 Tax=Fusibacter ferrireducens TaxID=2785058 RepID=A0ABR9ZPK3_9FIRM|nr:GNAT family N-acetyltransferase [Fusibacter ferrireducens]MBF4692398.1 GNAT family N-acetyltransferase [Fusibacter ferrireducens]
MIDYVKGLKASDLEIYKAFSIGYSDYMIKLEISEALFYERFFGPEGNQRELTIVAFDHQNPIGLIMGGIRMFNGIKTMRCGALCIAPEYRGQGISQQLMEMHTQMAREANCQQMMLEVLAGNDRAIKFYEKTGYEKVNELLYYSLKDPTIPLNLNHDVQCITDKNIEDLVGRDHLEPLNWQNDFAYVSTLPDKMHFGNFDDKGLLRGFLTLDKKGKIYQLWVKPEYRLKGLATAMVAYAQKRLALEVIHMSFVSNPETIGFLNAHHFKRLDLYQFEMYKALTR